MRQEVIAQLAEPVFMTIVGGSVEKVESEVEEKPED